MVAYLIVYICDSVVKRPAIFPFVLLAPACGLCPAILDVVQVATLEAFVFEIPKYLPHAVLILWVVNISIDEVLEYKLNAMYRQPVYLGCLRLPRSTLLASAIAWIVWFLVISIIGWAVPICVLGTV